MGELISFRIEGPILEKNIPLDIALDSLTAFQNIVYKSYLALSQSQRVSKKTREEFRITFTKIEKGSLNVDLDMVLAAVITAQMTMPFITSLTPKAVWDLTKNSFNYLKFVLESINKGKLPTYSQTGDGMLLVNNGDGNITVNQITYNVAKESLCDYQEMAKLTKKGVEKIVTVVDKAGGFIRVDDCMQELAEDAYCLVKKIKCNNEYLTLLIRAMLLPEWRSYLPP